MPIEILTPEEVKARRAANPLHRYPTAHKGRGRLLPYARPQIVTDDRIAAGAAFFVAGDSFARTLEAGLRRVERSVLSSPDWLDKPESGSMQFNAFNLDVVSNALAWALDEDAPAQTDALVALEGKWIDMQIHPTFAHDEKTALAYRAAYTDSFRALPEADVILAVVTGIEQWFDRQSGLYLNAMPNARMIAAHPDRFELHRLDADACAARLERFCELVASHGKPEARVLVAVSPVAQVAVTGPEDALVDQFLAKSIQRTACNRVAGRRARVDYLPALETAILSDFKFGYLDTTLQHTTQGLADRVLAQMLADYGDTDEAQRHLHGLGHAEAKLLADDPAGALKAIRPAMAEDGFADDDLDLFMVRALTRLDRPSEAIDLLLDRLETQAAQDPDRLYAELLDLAEGHGSLGQIDRLLALSPDQGTTEENPADADTAPEEPRDLRAEIEAAAAALRAGDNLEVIKRSIVLLEAEEEIPDEAQERAFGYLVQAMMREGQQVHLLPVLLDRIEHQPDPGQRWPALAVKLARSHADLALLRDIQRLREKFPDDIDMSGIDARVARYERNLEEA